MTVHRSVVTQIETAQAFINHHKQLDEIVSVDDRIYVIAQVESGYSVYRLQLDNVNGYYLQGPASVISETFGE